MAGAARPVGAAPFVAPFLAFAVLLAIGQLLEPIWKDGRYWIYPLQTFVCGTLLWRYHRSWLPFATSGLSSGLLVGVISWIIWITPGLLPIGPGRTDGFNLDRFGPAPALYTLILLLRLARLVVVVPLLEELFWRGFLLRYLIDRNFQQVRFGALTPFAFAMVTIFFMLEHAAPDWPAALGVGALYNWLAYRTGNLYACILAHAVTNLLLGAYVIATRQWGYW